jgi:hypothetical protein
VFPGRYGGWAFFYRDQLSDDWYDSAVDAMRAAIDLHAEKVSRYDQQRERQRAKRNSPYCPECFRFFGLQPPVTRNDVMACYRKWARVTHPDCGGTNDAFREVQRHFENALRLVGVAG